MYLCIGRLSNPKATNFILSPSSWPFPFNARWDFATGYKATTSFQNTTNITYKEKEHIDIRLGP